MAQAKIKKRPDGRYMTQVDIEPGADGKRRRITIYGRTIKEVEAKKAEKLEEIRKGTLSTNEKATFGEVADKWLFFKRGQLGEKGIRQYNHYQSIVTNKLQPLLHRKVKDLKQVDLDMILSEYAQKGKSKKTLIYIIQTASQVMEYAVENDLAFRNVFAKVKIPDAPVTERQPLTDEQIRLVTQNWQDHRAGIGALIMLYCGLRRGELIPLTWADVDLTEKTISINKSVSTSSNIFTVKQGAKTAAGSRVVDIPDFIIPALKLAKEQSNSFLVFPDAEGGMLTNQGYERLWESFMHYLNIKAGGKDRSRSKPKIVAMEPFTAHQLRHTYATMLYDAGVDPKSAQQSLGHASLDMTLQIYTHLSQKKKADSIAKLNEFLNAQNAVI